MSRCGCGCCSGTQVATPLASYNRPGLAAIAYRSGTHGSFLDSMRARLAGRGELQRLTTRDLDDPSMALLDCWAVVGDILTFYTERIANEGYLSTATEPESLVHLGRLVGYRPRPALGSSGYLAFTLEPDAATVIPAGSQAKSVPASGQLPQTFETSEDLSARADWNSLEVRRTSPPAFGSGSLDEQVQLTVSGTATGLKAGDRLLFVFSALDDDLGVRVVASVKPDFALGRTVVELAPVGSPDRDPAVAAAMVRLDAALDRALDAAPQIPASAELVAVIRQAQTDLSDGPNLGALAELVRGLREGTALARAHPAGGMAAWLDGQLAAAADAAADTLRLVAAAERHSPPEIDYLRRLGIGLTCPPEDREVRRRAADQDCDVAVPLVASAAILPALRKPPSRPPATARSLAPDLGQLFAPQSDVHTSLLAAADPRLSGTLQQAMGNQAVTEPPATSTVLAMRVKASAVAPTDGTLAETQLLLDGAVDAITPGSWAIISELDNPNPFVRQVVAVEQFRQELRLAATGPTVFVPVTLVTFDRLPYTPPPVEETKAFNEITVWAGGEPLQPAEVPISDDVGGSQIQLARMYEGLQPGRRLVVSGERTDIPGTTGVTASELTMVAGVEQVVDLDTPGDAVRPTLLLATPLAYTYKRDTVALYGNVVAATQGETRTEVLGSGDASKAGQTFPLRQVTAQSPLTWLPADNPLGAQDTLVVRVDGVQWHETDALVRVGPTDRGFTTVPASDGSVGVTFGDGQHGSRVPTGVENVTARYRVGAGRSGNVDAGGISQLASRPLGVNAVVNPLPATGGADGDGPSDARVGTPLRSLALDRLLSVADFADFTRARAGIGRASARRLFDGRREVVHVTIAAIDDAPVDPTDALFGSLEASLADFGDPHLAVRVAVRDLVLLVLSAGVKVLPDYAFELVEPAVRVAVLTELGFGNRQLGEPAFLSKVVAAMQAVPGVDYVDVDVFGGLPGNVDPITLVGALAQLQRANPVVQAELARYDQVVHEVEVDETGALETLSTIALRNGVTLDELARLNPGLRSTKLREGQRIVVFQGIRPAQLAVLPSAVPQTLTLRRIP
jgi:predicted phage baseplate assembly protein